MAKPESNFNELVEENSQNLHQIALTVLEIKDNVDNGFFDIADDMTSLVIDSLNHTKVALQGLNLMQKLQ